MRLARIISGAQTGVDLAALDAALAVGFPCGGWVPRGHLNEDGPIDARYPVAEPIAASVLCARSGMCAIPTRRSSCRAARSLAAPR